MAEATEDGISGFEFAQRVVERMPDLAPEPERFDEGPAVEVVEDGVTDPVTPEADAEVAAQPRDPETGKFLPKEKPEGDETEEPTAEAETPEAETTEAERLLAGKYRNEEELEKAYLEAERRLGEMKNEVGTSRQELAELKSSLDERFEQLAARMDRPPIVPITRDMIEEDPAAAAAQALQNGDSETLMEAVQVWKDEDPFEAAVFWTNLLNEYRADMARAQGAALAEPATPAPAAAPDPEAEVNAAAAEVLRRNPDLEQFLPQIGEVLRERPYLRNILESGAPQDRAAALEDAYSIAKSRHVAATSDDAKKQAELERAQAARAARADAQVISAARSSAASETGDRVSTFKQAFRQHTGLPLDDVE